MKFDHNKHNAELFTYDLKVLVKMIGMLDEEILEQFKELFLPNIESREIEDIDIDIDRA